MKTISNQKKYRKYILAAGIILACLGLSAMGYVILSGRSYAIKTYFSNKVAASTPKDPIQKGPIPDPSFEFPRAKNKFGLVFKYWDGWIYSGDAKFSVSPIAHTGKSSCLMTGAVDAKIRIFKKIKAPSPGRYKITAYIRGLDIGTGKWNQTTGFAFNSQHFPLNKNGTFGWTKLTYVADVNSKKDTITGPSIGLFAPGFLWVDDVTLTRVDKSVALTPEPIIGQEEVPIKLPNLQGQNAKRCPVCDYQNPSAAKQCFACGETFSATKKVLGNSRKILADFESKDPFSGGKVVSKDSKTLQLKSGFVTWQANQDWSDFDEFSMDILNDGASHQTVDIEIRDAQTTDYWSRVNYRTVVPTGKSTVTLSLNQLFVGEKSRPGRPLKLDQITRLVINIGDEAQNTLYLDNLRLNRDTTTRQKQFDRLMAFDVGPQNSPLMPGFTRLSPAKTYTKGRGFGLKNAKIWRSFDALQPDPLYQDFICIENGEIAIDLPNGEYTVFLNLTSPSGYWGEVQSFKHRKILAEGKPIINETQSFDQFVNSYFKFWNTDDKISDNTFNKYISTHFDEKQFSVSVTDGQLNIGFKGENWACSISTLIVFPTALQKKGDAFLAHVQNRRRFFFDNYFKRVIHKNTGDQVVPTPDQTKQGYIAFHRNYMADVYENDTPKHSEVNAPATAEGFAGDIEPITMSLYPLKDLGSVQFQITDLKGPDDINGSKVIPQEAITGNYISNRISRETMEGSVYTIKPRVLMPAQAKNMAKHQATRLWFTIKIPADAAAGLYRGTIKVTPQKGLATTYPVTLKIHPGSLHPVDIPVGPWGHSVDIPWIRTDEQTQLWNKSLADQSLALLKEHGFTTFTGIPKISYRGFKNNKPILDFSRADKQMKLARKHGFSEPIINYNRISGLNLYRQDKAAMNAAGIKDYRQFVKTVFSAIQTHADQNNWLPVYWNLGDEPIGSSVKRSIDNAAAYHKAFPKGPPFFTIATSYTSDGPYSTDEHKQLVSQVALPNLAHHDKGAVQKLLKQGKGWSMYNGGNRWTMGIYMYKAAKQYGLKMRLNWHWNIAAGDPYYALDCREDDYAWASGTPSGGLITSVEFEREMREGIDDYRHLVTLEQLAKKHNDKRAKDIIKQLLDGFELGDTRKGKTLTPMYWTNFRKNITAEITRLRALN